MIKALHCNSNDHFYCSLMNLDTISDLLRDKGNLFWLDLLKPTQQDLEKVAEEFGFHPLAVEDATHQHQRPKIDNYHGYFFIVFYAISLSEDKRELHINELNM